MTEAGILKLAVDRLVAKFNPMRVVLFGSRARQDHRPDSDVDLLVIMPDPADRRALAIEMRRALSDLPVAKDVVVSTPAELARRGNMIGSVLRIALNEGKVLFERA